MKPWTYFIIFIASVFFLISCHSSRSIRDKQLQKYTISFDKITSDSVIKRIEKNQMDPFLSAKGDLKFSNATESLEGDITFHSIKDSLYLVILKKLGIELIRILITKDSVHVLDRINQSYELHSLDEISNKFNIPIDFPSIHQIITCGSFIENKIYYEFNKNPHQPILYASSEFQTLTYKLDTLTLLPYSFKAEYPNQHLQVDVLKSINFSGKWIPSHLKIGARNSEQENINIEINWNEIKLDPILSVKFIIPNHYSRSGQ